MMLRAIRISIGLLCVASAAIHAQVAVVTGKVEFFESGKSHPQKTFPATVVWLTPAAGTPGEGIRAVIDSSTHPRLIQKNKSFSPHLLVVPVGSAVEFPNHDPFFHNVFSLFEGKRFDLGLYEAGSARMVHFDQPGISYIFCNIHPEMSAVVIALNTRLNATSDSAGQVRIPDVPYGRYVLHVWSERALPDALQSITREITISAENTSLGAIRLAATSDTAVAHKNKYGRDYDQPSPSNPIYPQP
jgi:plastocyanin